MEHPRLWGGAQAKKGPSEGEFFFFLVFLVQEKSREELSADGAPLAGGNIGCINQKGQKSSPTGRGASDVDIEAEGQVRALSGT